MRTLFVIPLILMSLVSFPSWGVTMDDLVIRAGLYYEKFTATPFTGEVEGVNKGKFKGGKKEGPWEFYSYTGQLIYKGNFKNGKKEGPWEFYRANGQLLPVQIKMELWIKGNYENGKKEGSWEGYNKDGTVDEQWTGTYKNGVKVSD